MERENQQNEAIMRNAKDQWTREAVNITNKLVQGNTRAARQSGTGQRKNFSSLPATSGGTRAAKAHESRDEFEGKWQQPHLQGQPRSPGKYRGNKPADGGAPIVPILEMAQMDKKQPSETA